MVFGWTLRELAPVSGGAGVFSYHWRGGWGGHCGAPAAAGTGVLRALVAADRTGEPVSGPRAVEAGKAEIPAGDGPQQPVFRGHPSQKSPSGRWD